MVMVDVGGCPCATALAESMPAKHSLRVRDAWQDKRQSSPLLFFSLIAPGPPQVPPGPGEHQEGV